MDRLLIEISGGLVITSRVPPAGVVGQAMPDVALETLGNIGNVNWSVSSGALPGGIGLIGLAAPPGGPPDAPTSWWLQGSFGGAYILDDGLGVDNRARYTLRAVDEVGQVAELAVVQAVHYSPPLIISGVAVSVVIPGGAQFSWYAEGGPAADALPESAYTWFFAHSNPDATPPPPPVINVIDGGRQAITSEMPADGWDTMCLSIDQGAGYPTLTASMRF